MNHDILKKETKQLARAVNRALLAAGCIHRLKTHAGTHSFPVPLEHVRYDPDTGCLWVEINPARLPRGFSFSRLHMEGLQEKVIRLFHRRVVLMQRERAIIIASKIGLSSRPDDTMPLPAP